MRGGDGVDWKAMFNGLIDRTISGEVTINEGVTEVRQYLFEGCTLLTGVNMPSSIMTIGFSAFSGTGVENITLPDGVTIINSQAFSQCKSLVNVHFSAALQSIKGSAFNSCTALRLIDLPSSVTGIEGYAFWNCRSLEGFICRASTPPQTVSTFFGGVPAQNVPYFYVPDESLDAYKTATGWSTYADRFKPLSEFVES